uniref:Uncharacterized protein n=1 Tax=viral metagenome TaxID=1070528 RepID=A0A6M3J6U8_9ZZZZ
MKYKLKRGCPPFEVVDGPMAGRKYARGAVYEEKEIPPQYRGRFEEIGASSARIIKKPAAKDAAAGEERKMVRGKEGKKETDKGEEKRNDFKRPGAFSFSTSPQRRVKS